MKLQCKYHTPVVSNINTVSKCIYPEHLASNILLRGACHVDHEGFDLNEIEQTYYEVNGLEFAKDSTWYKDGGQDSGTTAILQDWVIQTDKTDLIIDHSHFVFKYPITGDANKQIKKYTEQKPELLRILSVNFKCGLDLCIDYINKELNIVEPVVHIEWDFFNVDDLISASKEVEEKIESACIERTLPAILEFNKLARDKKIDAFTQADVRSLLIFGHKSYKLIPTI